MLPKFWNFFYAQLSWASSAELSMKKVLNCWYFYFYDQVKFHAQLSWGPELGFKPVIPGSANKHASNCPMEPGTSWKGHFEDQEK